MDNIVYCPLFLMLSGQIRHASVTPKKSFEGETTSAKVKSNITSAVGNAISSTVNETNGQFLIDTIFRVDGLIVSLLSFFSTQVWWIRYGSVFILHIFMHHTVFWFIKLPLSLSTVLRNTVTVLEVIYFLRSFSLIWDEEDFIAVSESIKRMTERRKKKTAQSSTSKRSKSVEAFVSPPPDYVSEREQSPVPPPRTRRRKAVS